MKYLFRVALGVAAVEVILAVLLVPIGNPTLIFGFIFGTAILALIGFIVFCLTSSHLATIRALREANQQQFQGYQQALSAVMLLSARQAKAVERAFQAGAYLGQLKSGDYVVVLPDGQQATLNEEEAVYFQELEENKLLTSGSK